MNNEDKTKMITLMPDRLNRIPVVYKGMTVTELMTFLGIGAAIGFVLGLILFVIFGSWVLIVTGIFAVPLPLVYLFGGRIARLKRGKPDTWFTRYMELYLAKKGFNGNKLLYSDEHFIVRRKDRRYNK